MEKEAGPEITQMPTFGTYLRHFSFSPHLGTGCGGPSCAIGASQVGHQCCCRGPCSPQALSPLEQGILEKPLVGLGRSWRQQAAVRSRGLCCSLGNHTQARDLMNSGSLRKSCWEVQSVPVAPEPLTALFAGEAAVPQRSLSPRRAPRGARYFPPGGETKRVFSFPTWTLIARWCWFFLSQSNAGGVGAAGFL